MKKKKCISLQSEFANDSTMEMKNKTCCFNGSMIRLSDMLSKKETLEGL